MNDYILYIEDNYLLKGRFKYLDKKFKQERTYLSYVHTHYDKCFKNYILDEVYDYDIMFIEHNALKDEEGNVYENFYTCDL